MKIRTDFVTNSSSTSYMVLSVGNDIIDKILEKEGIDPNETDIWEMFFKANNLEAIGEDNDIRWLGWSLSEEDLRKKTLNQLEIELVDELNKAYNLGITYEDIFFDMDTIYD